MKINYEGNEDVQLRKVVTLTCHYEFFTIKDGEIMDDMFERIQNLLNRLKVLDKNFSKAQINQNFVDNMPKGWEAKPTLSKKCGI